VGDVEDKNSLQLVKGKTVEVMGRWDSLAQEIIQAMVLGGRLHINSFIPRGLI
jgi:hypothetical protein